MHLLSQWLIVAPLFVAISVSGQDEDCLVKPYISAFEDFRADLVSGKKGQETYSFYLRFKVNYDYTAEISNLSYAEYRLFSTPATRVRILTREKDTQITYTSANYPDPKDPKLSRHASFTKSDYFREAKRIYDRLGLEKRLGRLVEVAPLCSPAYIYNSDLIIPLKEKGVQLYSHLKSHGYISCYKDYRLPMERLIISHDGYNLFKHNRRYNGIVATAYSNFKILHAFADGAIMAEALTEKLSAPGAWRTPKVSLTSGPGKRADKSNATTILSSPACYERLRKVKFETRQSYIDFDSSRPFRTLTQAINGSANKDFFVAEAADESVFHRYHTDNAGQRKRTVWKHRGVFVSNELSKDSHLFLVSSMAIFENKGLNRVQAIFRSAENITHIFYVNSEIRPDYSVKGGDGGMIAIKANRMAEPDDITYWSSCERIVSFFGFMYSLHHFKANIFEEPAKWNILSEKLFDYPIEAVHADGDTFYFFTKSSTVYRMVANSRTSCTKLHFTNKTMMHVSEFLGFKLKQFHTEGRYYNSAKKAWIPSWNSYRSDGTDQSTSSTTIKPGLKPTTKPAAAQPEQSSLWLYVGLGILALLLIVTVIVVTLVYMSRRRNQARRVR